MAEKQPERGTWSGKLDFTFSALSFAVGMGNLWRFPYLCYRSGGGAFLIPYIISMVLAGYPLMFIEMALGQFAGKGIVSVWEACPIFKGIGWGMFSVSVFTGLYYNMIVAWCFFYLFASFAKDVPWRSCDNHWNTQDCLTGEVRSLQRNCTHYNGTWVNTTCVTEADVGETTFGLLKNMTRPGRKSPEDEFFNNHMLDVSGGFHEPGMVQWPLALCFLLCWLIVFVALAKGIKVSGKVTYVTALFPYVVLLILLVRGLTLEGSVDGILYYVTPQWDKLLTARVWGDAAVQAFFSLSLCWGGLISLASFNKFHNDCLRDSIVVATGDMMTSIFGGFVIFAFIGYMSHELDVPVDQVATQGPGLAFVVYPEAVTKLPISPLWASLFMLMLINIGIGSQMGLVSTVHTTLLDVFDDKLTRGRRPFFLLAALCITGYVIGLTLTTRGGIYFLLLMDTYSATYALLLLALGECVAIGWIYGVERFYNDIEQMLGRRISPWWQICWRFIDPALILFILFFVFVDFTRSSYRDYVFPVHWEVLGWGIVLVSVAMIPIIAMVQIWKSDKGTLRERIRHLMQPSAVWGPAVSKEYTNGKDDNNDTPIPEESILLNDTKDPTV